MPRDMRYLGFDELAKRIALLDAAIDAGSQTGVGIEPRVNHTFGVKTDSELRFARMEYALSGHFLARQSGDKNLCAMWPDPRSPQITAPNFGGAIALYEGGYPEV